VDHGCASTLPVLARCFCFRGAFSLLWCCLHHSSSFIVSMLGGVACYQRMRTLYCSFVQFPYSQPSVFFSSHFHVFSRSECSKSADVRRRQVFFRWGKEAFLCDFRRTSSCFPLVYKSMASQPLQYLLNGPRICYSPRPRSKYHACF